LTQFSELGLGASLMAALAAEGYVAPTPIQAQAIPPALAGRDVLGIAQTGTGKTAAFALPILERLASDRGRPGPGGCRVLVLAPTRELASQIALSFTTYGKGTGLSTAVVFGGVDIRRQIRALARGVDILVATPGRLVDHMGQGTVRLDAVRTVVLDEVDRMLDIGFIHAMRRILGRVPAGRQTLFFSATLPPDIARLAAELLHDPVVAQVVPAATTVERVEQRVIHVAQAQKRALLTDLLADSAVTRALVFTRTKHGADRVTRQLAQAGVEAAAIHGNRSQSQRERALAGFRAGSTRVLVATDIAARGIDVDGVSHVINFDLPDVPESYVHRIGRTARAGAAGRAISFCDPSERGTLRDIEATIRQRVPVMAHAGLVAAPAAAEPGVPSAAPRPGRRGGRPAHVAAARR
jgi:ATP-dependent RNA helicase RhlE